MIDENILKCKSVGDVIHLFALKIDDIHESKNKKPQISIGHIYQRLFRGENIEAVSKDLGLDIDFVKEIILAYINVWNLKGWLKYKKGGSLYYGCFGDHQYE